MSTEKDTITLKTPDGSITVDSEVAKVLRLLDGEAVTGDEAVTIIGVSARHEIASIAQKQAQERRGSREGLRREIEQSRQARKKKTEDENRTLSRWRSMVPPHDTPLCPFGGHDSAVTLTEDNLEWWFVECVECGSRGPLAKSPEEALDLWAIRLTDQNLEG